MQKLITLAVFLVWSLPSYAYIGPGLGAGTIGVILGILGSIFLAIFGVFYYPIKRMLKNKKQKNNPIQEDVEEEKGSETNTSEHGS